MRSVSALQQAQRALDTWWRYPINPQTLSKVAAFGGAPNKTTYMQSCKFIWSEGAIRLAHIVREMRALPKVYLDEPNIMRVHDWYLQSYEDIASVDTKDEDEFAAGVTRSVDTMLLRHQPTVMSMAGTIRSSVDSFYFLLSSSCNKIFNR